MSPTQKATDSNSVQGTINYIMAVPPKTTKLLYQLIPKLDDFDVAICGGFPRRILLSRNQLAFKYDNAFHNSKPDIDIWARTLTDHDNIIEYLKTLTTGWFENQSEYLPFKVHNFLISNYRIQVINNIGSPADIIREFDFTHSQCFLANNNRDIVGTKDCLPAVINGWIAPTKEALSYKDYRFGKFFHQGFRIPTFEDYLYLKANGDDELRLRLDPTDRMGVCNGYQFLSGYLRFELTDKQKFMLNALTMNV